MPRAGQLQCAETLETRNMKEVATFLQNVLQGEAAVSVEVREGRGRCLVASKQIEVGCRTSDIEAYSLKTEQSRKSLLKHNINIQSY